MQTADQQTHALFPDHGNGPEHPIPPVTPATPPAKKNACEHCDHPTAGQRFCSVSCRRCESGVTDCAECKADMEAEDPRYYSSGGVCEVHVMPSPGCRRCELSDAPSAAENPLGVCCPEVA